MGDDLAGEIIPVQIIHVKPVPGRGRWGAGSGSPTVSTLPRNR